MFRQVTDHLFVSPQISLEDVAQAKADGFVLIVNNRPDGEEPGQLKGEDVEAAARAAGLGYHAVPVTHAGFSPWQLDGMAEALGKAEGGKVLAYCRSGTRSTLLWALTQAKAGHDPEALAGKAAAAGYDLSPVREVMDVLAAQAPQQP